MNKYLIFFAFLLIFIISCKKKEIDKDLSSKNKKVDIINSQVGLQTLIYDKADTYYRVATNTLNIRKGPNITSEIIDTAIEGTPLKLIEKTGILETHNKKKGFWIKIKTISSRIGYVFSGLCKKIEIHSVWSIDSNDGCGEADCFFYKDSYYYFSGWKQKLFCKWSTNKLKEITIQFCDNLYFKKILKKIESSGTKLTTEWKIKSVDSANNKICFKVQKSHRVSGFDGYEINFFGYYMNYFLK